MYTYLQGRITSELVGIGAQCRGERHDQIIMRQREALAELRARVKTLEQARPPCEWEVFFWWGVGGGWGGGWGVGSYCWSACQVKVHREK